MPIYEFRCSSCDKKFEKLCRMGEKEGVTCPDCGAGTSPLFSTFAAHIAGGSSSGSSCSGCASGQCGSCNCGHSL